MSEAVRLYSWLVAAATTIVALWLKGATAIFYARRFDIDLVPVPPRPDL